MEMRPIETSRFTDSFSGFWWDGVKLAGYGFFGNGTEACFEAATDKDELRPNFRKIKTALAECRKTYSEELFLVQMCSFYNASATNDLLIPRLDPSLSMGRTATSIDVEHRYILAGLMAAYSGW